MTIFYQSYKGYTRQCSLVFGWNLQNNGKLLDFPKSGYDWMFTGGDDWSDLLPPYYIPTVSPFSLFGSLVISSTKRKSELHFLSPFIHPGRLTPLHRTKDYQKYNIHRQLY